MSLNAKQVEWLLRPIQPARVAEDPSGHSHLPQQDVRAHLTRIFGFGGWSSKIVESSLVFEEAVTWQDRRSKATKSGYDACYRATVQLTIRDEHGQEVAQFEDVATGDAQHQTRLGAHDLALKSAVSTALKRAATCLGDQFGLSLYNKGSMDTFVLFTLVGATTPEPAETPAATPEEAPAEASTTADDVDGTGVVPPLTFADIGEARAYLASIVAAKYPGKSRDQIITEITESAKILNPPASLENMGDVVRLITMWEE